MTEQISIKIDPTDIQCPVTFERYTQQNYPVTLPCGHVLSIEAFRQIQHYNCQCPTCRKRFERDYHAEKAILLDNIVKQAEANKKKKPYCHNHPNQKAVALCFVDRAFLCLYCFKEDNHNKDQVFDLESLKARLQEIKNCVKQNQNILAKIHNSAVGNEIIESNLAGLRPIIEQIVHTELKVYTDNLQLSNLDKIANKVGYLLGDNLAVENTAAELESVQEMWKNSNLSTDPQKDMDGITQRITNRFQEKLVRKNPNQDAIKRLDIQVDEDLTKLVQLPDKEKETGVRIKVGQKFRRLEEMSSTLCLFQRLKILQLDFYISESVSDAGVRSVCQALKNFTFLNTLQLNFYFIGWPSILIGDCEVEELSISLKHISFLTTLQLNFSGSNFIRDAGVKKLALALKSLPSLTTVQLYFTSCKKISDDGLKELISVIKDLPSLGVLQLEFSDCKLLDQQAKQELENLLKKYRQS